MVEKRGDNRGEMLTMWDPKAQEGMGQDGEQSGSEGRRGEAPHRAAWVERAHPRL